MLTNPRDAFRRQSKKVNKHGTIRYVRYGFLLKFYSNFEMFNMYRDLETRVTGHSRSSEPTRIDLPPMTSY